MYFFLDLLRRCLEEVGTVGLGSVARNIMRGPNFVPNLWLCLSTWNCTGPSWRQLLKLCSPDFNKLKTCQQVCISTHCAVYHAFFSFRMEM